MPRFSIALLSEDKSAKTWEGLRAVFEKLLHRFEDDGTPRVEVVPVDAELRSIVNGNCWRSTRLEDQARKRDLWRYIARKLAEPNGFVVFHYDGDRIWSDRQHDGAERQFEDELRLKVTQVLAHRDRPEEERARLVRRLIECVPFYSIEAWLYQATDRAIEICKERHTGAHVDKFRGWAADRTQLDDVFKVKDETCLRDHHNDELGRRVPVPAVLAAQRSLAAFRDALVACEELADALA